MTWGLAVSSDDQGKGSLISPSADFEIGDPKMVRAEVLEETSLAFFRFPIQSPKRVSERD